MDFSMISTPGAFPGLGLGWFGPKLVLGMAELGEVGQDSQEFLGAGMSFPSSFSIPRGWKTWDKNSQSLDGAWITLE